MALSLRSTFCAQSSVRTNCSSRRVSRGQRLSVLAKSSPKPDLPSRREALFAAVGLFPLTIGISEAFADSSNASQVLDLKSKMANYANDLDKLRPSLENGHFSQASRKLSKIRDNIRRDIAAMQDVYPFSSKSEYLAYGAKSSDMLQQLQSIDHYEMDGNTGKAVQLLEGGKGKLIDYVSSLA